MSVIAALATPDSVGGIGVIRISGEGCDAVADRVFRSVSGKKLSDMKGYRATYGHIFDESGVLDDCVALVFRAPHSFTGEDTVELSCHGGLYVTRRVLRLVLDSGAEPADRGEFTKRAFLNGKIDLSEAESVMNVISAGSEAALRSASQGVAGALSGRLDSLADEVVAMSASIAYWSDDPEEDVPEASPENLLAGISSAEEKLRSLIDGYDNSKAFTQGLSAVITGCPNVGKSTLMNLLTGYERSIVTDIAGTTRDVVEDTVRVGDVILRLSDTAGLRASDDAVEKIGIERAYGAIDSSELIIAVFDGSRPLTEDDEKLLERCAGRRCVAVINKSDLQRKLESEDIEKRVSAVVTVSASTGEGAEILRKTIESVALGGGVAGGLILTGERQRRCCAEALTSLEDARSALQSGQTADAVGVLLDEAASSLMALTGRSVSQAVVDEVFSTFCVGK